MIYMKKFLVCEWLREMQFLGAGLLTLEGGGGGGDFEKKIPASACRKKKIACSTNVIESQMVGPLGNTVQKKVTNVTF